MTEYVGIVAGDKVYDAARVLSRSLPGISPDCIQYIPSGIKQKTTLSDRGSQWSTISKAQVMDYIQEKIGHHDAAIRNAQTSRAKLYNALDETLQSSTSIS